MDRIATLFHPERWLTAWRAVGGAAYVTEPLLLDGELTDGLLEMGPTYSLAEPWDSPRRRKVAHLRAALAMPGARVQVIEYMRRQAATSGCVSQTTGD